MTHIGTFDPETVKILHGIVDGIWESFSPSQQIVFPKEEIARLVMLLAETGLAEPEEIKKAVFHSLLSDTAI
jgi:hypothetical protein